GSDYNPDNFRRGLINHTRLYDCATLAITSVGSPTTDTFCCGHALMEGGRLLIAGGTESYPAAIGYHHDHWPGVPDAWIFDANSGTWSHVAAMDGGRWYPTLVTLADGRVLAMSGHPSRGNIGRHINNTPEIFVPDENRWILRNALGYEGRQNNPRTGDPGFQVQYPRLHVLPNGDVFCVTPLYENEPSSVRYNPDTQVHSF